MQPDRHERPLPADNGLGLVDERAGRSKFRRFPAPQGGNHHSDDVLTKIKMVRTVFPMGRNSFNAGRGRPAAGERTNVGEWLNKHVKLKKLGENSKSPQSILRLVQPVNGWKRAMNEPGNGMNPRCLLKAWDSALTRSTHQKVPKNRSYLRFGCTCSGVMPTVMAVT